jgi:hypothetical protein
MSKGSGRDLYRATTDVIRGLQFSGFIRRTSLFSRLLRHTKGCGECILTTILTGSHSVASYDTQGDAEDLFFPGSSRVIFRGISHSYHTISGSEKIAYAWRSRTLSRKGLSLIRRQNVTIAVEWLQNIGAHSHSLRGIFIVPHLL